MNTFKIFSMLIFFMGLIASSAFAIDNISSLDASEFFYGDSSVNNSVVSGQTVSGISKEVASASVSLSAADFFYSEPISFRSGVVRGEDLPQRINVAVPSTIQNTPEIFYGYKDVIEVKEAPCENC